MRVTSRLFPVLAIMTLGSACSKNALSAGDAATDASTSNDLGSTNADVPPDAALTPPSGVTFPDAPQMSCASAGDCEFPPSACGRPDCDGQCLAVEWVVYYDNPTCTSGQCVFTKRYFQCSGGMACAMGGCFFNVTIP
jgi:hypothetical protein